MSHNCPIIGVVITYNNEGKSNIEPSLVGFKLSGVKCNDIEGPTNPIEIDPDKRHNRVNIKRRFFNKGNIVNVFFVLLAFENCLTSGNEINAIINIKNLTPPIARKGNLKPPSSYKAPPITGPTFIKFYKLL